MRGHRSIAALAEARVMNFPRLTLWRDALLVYLASSGGQRLVALRIDPDASVSSGAGSAAVACDALTLADAVRHGDFKALEKAADVCERGHVLVLQALADVGLSDGDLVSRDRKVIAMRNHAAAAVRILDHEILCAEVGERLQSLNVAEGPSDGRVVDNLHPPSRDRLAEDIASPVEATTEHVASQVAADLEASTEHDASSSVTDLEETTLDVVDPAFSSGELRGSMGQGWVPVDLFPLALDCRGRGHGVLAKTGGFGDLLGRGEDVVDQSQIDMAGLVSATAEMEDDMQQANSSAFADPAVSRARVLANGAQGEIDPAGGIAEETRARDRVGSLSGRGLANEVQLMEVANGAITSLVDRALRDASSVVRCHAVQGLVEIVSIAVKQRLVALAEPAILALAARVGAEEEGFVRERILSALMGAAAGLLHREDGELWGRCADVLAVAFDDKWPLVRLSAVRHAMRLVVDAGRERAVFVQSCLARIEAALDDVYDVREAAAEALGEIAIGVAAWRPDVSAMCVSILATNASAWMFDKLGHTPSYCARRRTWLDILVDVVVGAIESDHGLIAMQGVLAMAKAGSANDFATARVSTAEAIGRVAKKAQGPLADECVVLLRRLRQDPHWLVAEQANRSLHSLGVAHA